MPTNSPTSTEQVIERRLKIAFATSLMNANAGMKWLDHDSMDEMIGAAWVGFEGPALEALSRNTPADSEVERLLKKAREFAVLFLAFDGRDRHTDRQDRTYDDLSRMAVDLDAQLRTAIASLPPKPVDGAPIDMVLFCPKCGQQHIDKPDPDDAWDNPPHKSHKCVGPNGCGTIWRPADVPTNGIIATQSRGSKDTIFYNFAAIPPVDGEVAELVAWLRKQASDVDAHDLNTVKLLPNEVRRIADMLLALSRKTEPMVAGADLEWLRSIYMPDSRDKARLDRIINSLSAGEKGTNAK